MMELYHSTMRYLNDQLKSMLFCFPSLADAYAIIHRPQIITPVTHQGSFMGIIIFCILGG